MASSNDVLIIRIGSLSEFFSGSPIHVKAVLELDELIINSDIIKVHMSRQNYISVIVKAKYNKEYEVYQSSVPLEGLI